ncbi:hypothetical protein R1sor_019750 [Riccia sorocarpa]|uniref:Transmembrane protein 234 n=1 Tax=Riccia sorocarpa TaxID=122646 RepID=A0ABD3IDE1_9MARC
MVILWLLVIGSVWGTTNALIKRGALKAQEKQARREKEKKEKMTSSGHFWLSEFLTGWFHLLCVWEYSIPFLINLSASIFFFKQLGDSPINIAVPVTNATTFAVTAIAGATLGERVDVVRGLVGVGLIVVGVVLCISVKGIKRKTAYPAGQVAGKAG